MSFDGLIWKPDRLVLNDLTYCLGNHKPDGWDIGDECFVLWKDKKLVDQYRNFFASNPELGTNYIVELGAWDGGSAAFWCELLKPKKLVTIDHLEGKENPYFTKYKNKLQAVGKTTLVTKWNTTQEDKIRIMQILTEEFGKEKIDVVFDDASHRYVETKASFETIFPLLTSGSYYIIEDWAWLHWEEWVHNFPQGTDLTRFITELIPVTGTPSQLISKMMVYPGFVAVQRGEKILDPKVPFRLSDYVFVPDYLKATQAKPTETGIAHKLRKLLGA